MVEAAEIGKIQNLYELQINLARLSQRLINVTYQWHKKSNDDVQDTSHLEGDLKAPQSFKI